MVASLYFLLAVVFVPILYLVSRHASGGGPFPAIVMIVGPIAYGLFGYLVAVIGCWLYNIVASRTGGIALTLEPDEPGSASATS